MKEEIWLKNSFKKKKKKTEASLEVRVTASEGASNESDDEDVQDSAGRERVRRQTQRHIRGWEVAEGVVAGGEVGFGERPHRQVECVLEAKKMDAMNEAMPVNSTSDSLHSGNTLFAPTPNASTASNSPSSSGAQKL
eukprot:CAMPEP_0202959642 /NCGR_PEP_ID=MMETSP1396-20130829/3819_1 /ASSEMBLY_ACC=CAM_ASM_000872 /TAXON_ID= /ORGANISM="Pseudokeronopsis sp., Strain Brazil" /LENGTH=136 /DNA_ID=CAMNT_0049678315 /DNA_START=1127 /DNA_END=1539 /DNA_ORIENTATION=-